MAAGGRVSGNPWTDESNIVGDPLGWATGVNTAGFGGVKDMLFGSPTDLSGIKQASADSAALEKQFLAQMAANPNGPPTPGLSYTGSAPVVQATSSAPGAQAAGAQGQQVAGAGGQAYGGGGMPPPPSSQGFGGAAPPPGNGGPRALTGGGAGSTFGGPPTTGQPPTLGGGQNATNTLRQAGLVGGPAGTMSAANPTGSDSMTSQRQLMNTYGGGGAGGPMAPGMVASAMQAAQMQAGDQFNAAQLDPTQQAQFRQGEMGLVGNLQDTIAGKTPSVAQMQQQQAFAQQQAQQMGLAAAMGRGGNTALAMRTAANNMGNLGAQQAQASALQRAQETAMAQNQLGNVLAQGRGADIGLAGQNAQLQQQGGMLNNQNQWGMNQYNASNIQQGNALNAQLQQQANANNQQSQIGTRGQNIQSQSNQANQALQANQNMVNANVGAVNAQNQQRQNNAGIVSSVLGLISDKRLKKNVDAAGSSQFRDFLSKIKPSNFQYKGDDDDETGVMAQDVQKSRVGSGLVRETGIGKVIDVPRTTGALLASLADMHKRVSKLEGGRKKAA